MIVKDEITADYIGIQCDVCETMAPGAEAIREGHGLNNMGWLCSGGSHLCPSHAPPREVVKPELRTVPIETLVAVGERFRLKDSATVWEIVKIEEGQIFAQMVNGIGR